MSEPVNEIDAWVDVSSPFPDYITFSTTCNPFCCLYYLDKLLHSLKRGAWITITDPGTLCYWEYKVE